ncbi:MULTISPECIES: hypothetical protein [Cupriavidus]|uniref:Dickkopf N-terminal cysteine-rich domain-containing protein n=1 Tax=Cupriavidus oxalaticus TaxID=96344 RepID=A0A4P7LL82_9BURK|nr:MULTISPECIES: hypothetical protein [Cupriavidus]MBF6991332.1 hypothetical protein [Cupriavidus sp. IK-TO18]QBY52901.1 hypothetical protein E0W60_17260 [Cupriavidus oxalaticus]
MKVSALLLAASMAAGWSSLAQAAGCQYDMQCKGERICQQGQCVFPDAEETAEAGGPSPVPAPTLKRTPMPPPPRGCCTVAGKLKLSPASASDTSLSTGDACQGLTNSGKPVPGTICN